jgi:predicted porin
LNYDLTQNNNDSYTCNGPGFSTNDASVSTGLRDAVVTYQKKFDNTSKKLEFKLNYNNNTNNFELSPVGDMISILRNLKPKFVQYKV